MRQFAFLALIGVGDPSLGEWEEWTGYAYHVRRRLTPEEQAQVGEVVDIRGTPEAVRRLLRVQRYVALTPQGREVLQAEMTGGVTT